MDARHFDLLKRCDPAELGGRLRAVRLTQGLTQGDVAGDAMSVAYLSRMESGQRRPTAKVLAEIAQRLGVSVDELLGETTPRELDEIRLTLDYAELSLESGEAHEALTHVRAALERLGGSPADAMNDRARFLSARAYEALGRTDEALDELESLVGDGQVPGLMRVSAGIALSRVYRESGDLGRAIDTGERVLADLAESGLDSCDEAIQLTVTIAAAYFERGDSGHAVRICRAAIARAEALGSPRARASAYWNASAMQARRGDILSAAPLAERALALLSEGQDARNLARLRGELGLLQLALDPPDVDQARLNLEKAAEDLAWSSASPADRAWTQLGLARARFLAGDLAGSRELTTRFTRCRTATLRWPKRRRGPSRGRRTQPKATWRTLPGPTRKRSTCCRPSAPIAVRPSSGSTWPACSSRSGRPKQRATPTSGRPRRPGCGRARPLPRARWSSPSGRTASRFGTAELLPDRSSSDQQHQMVREAPPSRPRPGQPRPAG